MRYKLNMFNHTHSILVKTLVVFHSLSESIVTQFHVQAQISLECVSTYNQYANLACSRQSSLQKRFGFYIGLFTLLFNSLHFADKCVHQVQPAFRAIVDRGARYSGVKHSRKHIILSSIYIWLYVRTFGPVNVLSHCGYRRSSQQ